MDPAFMSIRTERGIKRSPAASTDLGSNVVVSAHSHSRNDVVSVQDGLQGLGRASIQFTCSEAGHTHASVDAVGVWTGGIAQQCFGNASGELCAMWCCL